LSRHRHVSHFKVFFLERRAHIVNDGFGQVDGKSHRLGWTDQVAERHRRLAVRHRDLVAVGNLFQGLRTGGWCEGCQAQTCHQCGGDDNRTPKRAKALT
jgi:hypothetical protein